METTKQDDTKQEISPFWAFMALLTIVPLGVWEGFVLSKLWSWFAMPLGADAIGMWQAAGLSTMIALPLVVYRPDPDVKKILEFAAYAPLVALILGAIYHAFM